jgi:hypothetical protein
MSPPGQPRSGIPADFTHVTWIKSSHSGPTGGNCVETAARPGTGLAVRDSRFPAGPALVFPAAAWASFVADLRARPIG